MVSRTCLSTDDNDTELLLTSGIWSYQDSELIAPFIELIMKTQLRRGQGVPGKVLETGEPIWIGRTDSDPLVCRRAKLADKCNLVSLIAIPVKAGDSTVAVLELFT